MFELFDFQRKSMDEMASLSESFLSNLDNRRSIREFSRDKFPIKILNNCIKAASTAPSGANKQPYKFLIIEDKKIRQKIRDAAEKEEEINYKTRYGSEWINDLKPFGTTSCKNFLTDAPYLVIVMRVLYNIEDGIKTKNYYVGESTGLATGIFLAAIHLAGLCSLTYTPSPMQFISEILKRPKNEIPYLVIPVGFPKEGTKIPTINRKNLDKIREVY